MIKITSFATTFCFYLSSISNSNLIDFGLTDCFGCDDYQRHICCYFKFKHPIINCSNKVSMCHSKSKCHYFSDRCHCPKLDSYTSFCSSWAHFKVPLWCDVRPLANLPSPTIFSSALIARFLIDLNYYIDYFIPIV